MFRSMIGISWRIISARIKELNVLMTAYSPGSSVAGRMGLLTRAKISAALTGKKHSDITRACSPSSFPTVLGK